MSFPTNTSPYGSSGLKIPSSPQMQQSGPQNGGNSWYSALFGKPEQNYRQSNLDQGQQPIYQQQLGAAQGAGAGGAFGQSADYYRGLLGDDSADFDAFAAPELRRFQEQTVPGLAEQFAGMGSGGLSSSGFRNAAVGAGTDLSERLGAIRAGLRQQGAQGLQSIGQSSLNTGYGENINRPETSGLLGGLAEGASKGLGQAAGSFLGGRF
jgi:hypothetical protein